MSPLAIALLTAATCTAEPRWTLGAAIDVTPIAPLETLGGHEGYRLVVIGHHIAGSALLARQLSDTFDLGARLRYGQFRHDSGEVGAHSTSLVLLARWRWLETPGSQLRGRLGFGYQRIWLAPRSAHAALGDVAVELVFDLSPSVALRVALGAWVGYGPAHNEELGDDSDHGSTLPIGLLQLELGLDFTL